MNKQLIIIVSIVTLLLVGVGSYVNYQNSQSLEKADRSSLASEQRFMQQMTSHHEDAIQMAEMAKEKAKNKQIQSLASAIITAQNKEVIDMSGWYKQWFGKDMPAMASMPGMVKNDGMNMGRLNSAPDFDLEFVSQMIPHHQKAVQMARAILPKAKHAELKRMADNIISSQTMEIQEMQQLQKQFQDYPIGSAARKAIDCGDDAPGC